EPAGSRNSAGSPSNFASVRDPEAPSFLSSLLPQPPPPELLRAAQTTLQPRRPEIRPHPRHVHHQRPPRPPPPPARHSPPPPPPHPPPPAPPRAPQPPPHPRRSEICPHPRNVHRQPLRDLYHRLQRDPRRLHDPRNQHPLVLPSAEAALVFPRHSGN